MQGKQHENVRYVHALRNGSWVRCNADFQHCSGITASSIIGGFSMRKNRNKNNSDNVQIAVLIAFNIVGVAIMAAYIIHG